MNLATKKTFAAIVLAGGLGIAPAIAEGDGTVLPDNQPMQSLAGPQGPAQQKLAETALGFAAAVTNPLASFNPPAPGSDICWVANDPDRPFGYWRACN